MDSISQLSIVLILLLEVTALTYIEYKSWHTIYTPLCALMLPYVVVLLITIAIAGNFGFTTFNYNSIWIWILGLPLFALPSYAFAAVMRHYGLPTKIPYKEDDKPLPTVLIVIAVAVSLLLLYRLYSTLSVKTLLFGTDDFADQFSGHGFWAHLRTLLIPILIIAMFQVKKKQYWLWLLIVLMLVIQFVNMVKGTIIIPIMAAILFRLYAGRMHLNLTLIFSVLVGGLVVFFLIYMVIPIMGNGGGVDMDLVEFVTKHFVHYFTSGTFGWSFDLDQGIPDKNGFSYIIAPFVNIYSTLAGQEVILPVNHFYWNVGDTVTTFTNVRTFFGTLYIYSDYLQFITYTLILSTFIYTWKVLAMLKQNIYLYVILFYYCGLLAMGWFEFYFFHLDTIEIPLITLFYMWASKWSFSPEVKGKEVTIG